MECDRPRKGRPRPSHNRWLVVNFQARSSNSRISDSWYPAAPEQAVTILVRGERIPVGTVSCHHSDSGRRLGSQKMSIWEVSERAILANQRIVRVSPQLRFVSCVLRDRASRLAGDKNDEKAHAIAAALPRPGSGASVTLASHQDAAKSCARVAVRAHRCRFHVLEASLVALTSWTASVMVCWSRPRLATGFLTPFGRGHLVARTSAYKGQARWIGARIS